LTAHANEIALLNRSGSAVAPGVGTSTDSRGLCTISRLKPVTSLAFLGTRGSGYNCGMIRGIALIFGVSILLIGIIGIAFEVTAAVADAINRDPNHRVITTFPFFTLYGTLCLWLGYRLIFTKPFKSLVPRPQKAADSC
jgi:hypothetical protein